LQRNFTEIRGKINKIILELEATTQNSIKEIEEICTEFLTKGKDCSGEERQDFLKKMIACFNTSLSHGENKVTLAGQAYDIVDKHIRRLDEDLQRFEEELLMTEPKVVNRGVPKDSPLKRNGVPNHPALFKKKDNKLPINAPSNAVLKRRKEVFNANNNNNVGKKDIRKEQSIKKKMNEDEDLPVDPNEPRYCICQQVSFGAMIGCDNDDCKFG
jgi:hypothetical protein